MTRPQVTPRQQPEATQGKPPAAAVASRPAANAIPTPPPRSLSLEEALSLGQASLLSVRQAALGVQAGQAALDLSQAAFLPRLDLVALGSYARVGTTFGFLSNLPTLGDLTLDLGFNGSAVVQNTFGNLGLALNYTLVDFRRGPVRQAARAGLASARALQQEEQRRSRFAITAAYLNLQLADALVPVWQSALRLSSELQRDARAIRARGLAARIDTLQAQALVLNDQQGLAQARASQAIAASALARLLDLPPEQTVASRDPLVAGPAWPLPLAASIRRALEQRPSLEALEQQRLARLAQLQLAHAGRLPSVALLLGGGINADVLSMPVFNGTPNVNSRPLPGVNAPGSVSGSFNDMGALITVRQPLYDGGSTRANIDLAQNQLAQQQLVIDQTRQSITQGVEQYWYDHQAAAEQQQAAAGAVKANREAVRDAQLRYRAGIAPLLEVLVAQRDLQAAQAAQASAIHRWNLSRAGLEGETGPLVPAGPASTAAAGNGPAH